MTREKLVVISSQKYAFDSDRALYNYFFQFQRFLLMNVLAVRLQVENQIEPISARKMIEGNFFVEEGLLGFLEVRGENYPLLALFFLEAKLDFELFFGEDIDLKNDVGEVLERFLQIQLQISHSQNIGFEFSVKISFILLAQDLQLFGYFVVQDVSELVEHWS